LKPVESPLSFHEMTESSQKLSNDPFRRLKPEIKPVFELSYIKQKHEKTQVHAKTVKDTKAGYDSKLTSIRENASNSSAGYFDSIEQGFSVLPINTVF